MNIENLEFDILDSPVNGALYTTSSPSKGVVLFGTGITSKHTDYQNLIMPLAEYFDVIALDNRGHHGNTSVFSAEKLQKTQHALVDEGITIDYQLGHSVGCSIDSNVPTFMINPFFGKDYTSLISKIGMAASWVFTKTRLHGLIESNIPEQKRINIGFNNYQFIHDGAELYNVEAPIITDSVGYIIANKDNIIGTDKLKQRAIINRKLQILFPGARDYSYAGRGLNHNLNLKDMSTFLIAEESHIHKGNVVETIANFYLNTL